MLPSWWITSWMCQLKVMSCSPCSNVMLPNTIWISNPARWREMQHSTASDFLQQPWHKYRKLYTMTPRCVFFALFAFRVCLGGAFEAPLTSELRQKAPLKWLTVQRMRIVYLIANGYWKTFSANQSCSFNCKWQPPMEELAFRVGRRIEFILDHNTSEALPWTQPRV